MITRQINNTIYLQRDYINLDQIRVYGRFNTGNYRGGINSEVGLGYTSYKSEDLATSCYLSET